ncbi:anti-adapter protein iraM, partial [Klebsiella oxytoca]|nr:anti-adapter protein iraM [Klebsiella oxytoca]
MEWNIENSLVCPLTGTGFSVAASARNLKLIIWYNG